MDSTVDNAVDNENSEVAEQVVSQQDVGTLEQETAEQETAEQETAEQETAEQETAEPAKSKSPRTQALYDQLKEEEAELEGKLVPYREAYERLVNDPQLIEATKQIKEISKQLAPVKNDLAMFVRMAGSRGIKADTGVYDSKPEDTQEDTPDSK